MINIELFPCSGGMARGFRDAGIEFDLAIEWERDHCDSYERNLGHRPVQMDVRDFLRMVQLGARLEVDLLVADPPCTPWSHAGKRKGTADERDMLAVTCDVIAALRPRRYLVGNVPGLDDATNLHIVQEQIGGLSRLGYCTADFVQLDAADFGVPQRRSRPFWFGHQVGPCIRWPAPTHADPTLIARASATIALPGIGVPSLLPWVTCRQALGHLAPEELGRPVRMRRRAQNESKSGPQSQRVMASDKPATTVSTATDRKGSASPKLEWPWDRPATTIQRDDRIAPPGHHDEWSDANAVQLSERAAMILQGFPTEWVICGDTKTARWSQIGQAMPPALAAIVARSIVEQNTKEKP